MILKSIPKTPLENLFSGASDAAQWSVSPERRAELPIKQGLNPTRPWPRLVASKALALRFRRDLFLKRPFFKQHWLLPLFVAVSAGCGGKPLPVEKKTTPKPVPNKLDTHIERSVDKIGYECREDSAELCNALDDNCNGVIDDGCGYSTGSIQITLGWDTGADIDLYVTDPEGDVIYYNEKNRHSASGGFMDHDARGDCRKEQKNTQIENVYWETEQPPKGKYKVEAEYWGPCGDYDATRITVSVSIKSNIIGVFRYTMNPEERVDVANFKIK